ncbi:MAG: hypothetical protein RL095_3380 [Verrucomicrobiota bacterium]|jgi:hypothetical protein
MKTEVFESPVECPCCLKIYPFLKDALCYACLRFRNQFERDEKRNYFRKRETLSEYSILVDDLSGKSIDTATRFRNHFEQNCNTINHFLESHFPEASDCGFGIIEVLIKDDLLTIEFDWSYDLTDRHYIFAKMTNNDFTHLSHYYWLWRWYCDENGCDFEDFYGP